MILTSRETPLAAVFDDTQRKEDLSLGNSSSSRQRLFVEEPLPDDILCGKDKRCMTHKGSLFFKGLIDAHVVPYREASSRQAKMEVTKTVFDILQTRRFLKWNDKTKEWEVLHPLSIRDKIGHALRFANRKPKTSLSSSSSSSSASAAKKAVRPRRTSSDSSSSSSSDSGATSCRSPSCDSSASSSPPKKETSQRDSLEVPPEVSFFSSLSLKKEMGKPKPKVSSIMTPGQGRLLGSSSCEEEDLTATFATNDLLWIMQLPMMEEDPKDRKIYYV